MIKNLDSLAERLKGIKVGGEDITPKKLSELIGSKDEHELTLREVHVFNDEDLNTLKANEGKRGHKEGLNFGTEKLVKAFRNVNGLEFEGLLKHTADGAIDFDGIVEHISNPLKDKVSKGLNKSTNEQVKEWESKYNTLKTTYDTDKGSWGQEKETLSNQLSNINKTTKLQSIMPELKGIKKEHASMIFQSEYNLEDREGLLIAKKGGEIVKDKVGNPLLVKDLFNTFASTSGWLKEAGTGGVNEPGGSGKFKNSQEAFDHMRKNKIDPMSQEGQELLQSIEQE